MSSVLPGVHLGPLTIAEPLRHRAGGLAVAYPQAERPLVAALMGTEDPHVCSLLTDVLRDIDLQVVQTDLDSDASPEMHEAVQELGERPPDVTLAMVDRVHGVSQVSDARSRFPKAPVVAILPLGTHRLATRAVAAGAQACYMLDMPIDRLRGLLRALVPEREGRDAGSRQARRGR